MPALPPVPKVIKVTLSYHVSTDFTVVNNLHWAYPNTAPDSTAMTTFAGSVSASWATYMAPVTHTSVSLVNVRAVDLSSDQAATGNNAGVHAGTRTGTALPGDTCALVNYPILRRYRGGKPRTYLPVGAAADLLDAQHWTTTFRSAAETAFQQFQNAVATNPPVGSGQMSMVSISYYQKFHVHYGSTGRAHNISDLRVDGPKVDPILSISVSQTLASQRRRQRA